MYDRTQALSVTNVLAPSRISYFLPHAAETPGVSTGFRARIAWPSIAVVVLAAAILRFATADYSLSFDDYATVFFSSQTYARLWSSWMVRETNPPLYYSLIRLWISLFGNTAFMLRVPAVVASLTTIVVFYNIMAKHYGQTAAITAALLLSLSAQQLFYSHQVRGYTALFLFVSISYMAVLSILRSERVEISTWAVFVLSSGAAIYLHTTACIWPAAATAGMLLVDRRFVPFVGKRWRELVIADLCIVLISAWWLYITYLQVLTPNQNISWIHWPGFTKIPLYFGGAGLLVRAAHGWQMITLALLIALAILGAVRTRSNVATQFAVICAALTVAGFTLLSLKQPIIVERTILWFTIFPLTLISAGLASIANRRAFLGVTAATLGLVAINLATALPNLMQENWRTPLQQIAGARHGVVVVQGQAISNVINSACAVELQTRSCPFAVLTVIDNNDHYDSWAHGYAMPAPKSARTLQLPSDARVFLLSRTIVDEYNTFKTLARHGVVADDGHRHAGPARTIRIGISPAQAARSHAL